MLARSVTHERGAQVGGSKLLSRIGIVASPRPLVTAMSRPAAAPRGRHCAAPVLRREQLHDDAASARARDARGAVAPPEAEHRPDGVLAGDDLAWGGNAARSRRTPRGSRRLHHGPMDSIAPRMALSASLLSSDEDEARAESHDLVGSSVPKMSTGPFLQGLRDVVRLPEPDLEPAHPRLLGRGCPTTYGASARLTPSRFTSARRTPPRRSPRWKVEIERWRRRARVVRRHDGRVTSVCAYIHPVRDAEAEP